jgi:hypothetical protein
MPSHEFKEWSQCPRFRENGDNKLISKKDLIARAQNHEKVTKNVNFKQQNTSTSNLSPETLEHMADTKRKVDAGLLPKYIGGTTEQSNPEIERQAESP